MMRPHFARRIAGNTARAQRNGPVRLTRSTRSHSSSGIWSNGRISSVEKMPALLMSTSMRPYSSSTISIISLIEASSATSVVTASAWPPASRISSDTAAAFASFSSAMTARAPGLRERLGEDAADALAGAGDDDDAVLERGENDVVEGGHAALFLSGSSCKACRAFHGVHHGFSPRSSAMMPAVM